MGESNLQRLPLQEALRFIATQQSLELATLDRAGLPDISYTPFIQRNIDSIFIYVSNLAKHTDNLRANNNISVMVIEPETNASQIYARQRCVLRCHVTEQSNLSVEAREALLLEFETRHGAIIKMLKTLPDFHLFCLQPTVITLVQGFGRAYRATRSPEGDWPDYMEQLRSS